MYFDSMQDFFAMGGHGRYVWMAYSGFLIIVVWNLFRLRLNRQQLLRSVERTWQRESGSEQAKNSIGESES